MKQYARDVCLIDREGLDLAEGGGSSEGMASENLNSFLVLLFLHRALSFLYRNERPNSK